MTELTKKSQNIIIFIVSVVMFMEFLDTTIINTAVPSIARSFGQDPLLLKFSVTSYFLSLAIFTPISGWFADKLGTKKIFLFSVSLFVFASLLCGISTNIIELTFFRFLQGMGGAFMNPVSRIIILRIFKPSELVRVQGIIFTPAMLGFILGPFLGGVITTYLTWRWIFFINIPVGLCVIYYALSYIPQQIEPLVKKFDWIGFFLSAISLGLISFSVDMFGHGEILNQHIVHILGIIGFSLLCILIFYCLNKKNAVFNLLLFKIKTFQIGFFANLNMYMITSSISFLLPLMYQEQFLMSPVKSGILVLPIAFGQLFTRFFASRIITFMGFKRSFIISCLSCILSVFLIHEIHVATSLTYIIFSELLYGISVIIYASTTGALTYIDVPKNMSSQATSLDLTSRQFSSSMGVAISALLLNSLRNYYGIQFGSPQGIKIFQLTFLIISGLGLIAVIQGFRLSKNEGNHALKS